jgi:hypothetical protein
VNRLGSKLLQINRKALLAGIGIVTGAVIVSSFAISLRDLSDTSRIQARVLADNLVASLVFKDSKSAQDLLQSLRHSPAVHYATLFSGDGAVFASFDRDNGAARLFESGKPTDLAIGLKRMEVTEPVEVAQGRRRRAQHDLRLEPVEVERHAQFLTDHCLSRRADRQVHLASRLKQHFEQPHGIRGS